MNPNHKEFFRYLNCATFFSSEGDDNIRFARRACFNEVVQYHREFNRRCLKSGEIVSNKYTVRVIFANPIQDINNCCLLSIDEFHEWVEDMKRFAEFEFNIRNDNQYPEGDAILVDIEFKERPFAEHFLVLEMIKHSYEGLFNFSVYQAVKLRKIINPDELLINLHNMIFCCNDEFRHYSCSDHTIVYAMTFDYEEHFNNVCVLKTAEEIKECLSVTKMLSSIFDPAVLGIEDINNYNDHYDSHYAISEKRLSQRAQMCFDQKNKFKYIKDSNVTEFSKYFNPELCKKRLNAYIETYEKIRIDNG